MSANRWGQLLGWTPSFRSILRNLNRTGYFANDVLDRDISSPVQPTPILEAAKSMRVLSPAAAVGLEIILHDVNIDTVLPGIVTRVNLPDALQKLTLSVAPNNAQPEAEEISTTEVVGNDVSEPVPSLEIPVADAQNPEEAEEEDGENPQRPFSDLSLLPLAPSSQVIDERFEPQAPYIKMTMSKSFGYRNPTWFDHFGAFQPLAKATSLPNRHFFWKNASEVELPFVTCQMALYDDILVPVPASHAWRWYTMEELDVLEEKPLGEGTFATVFQASIAFYSENMGDEYTIRSVAVKTFLADKCDMGDIVYETDISAYMSSIGVGPDILGLLKAHNEEELPSLLMNYYDGSADLISLFSAQQKPSRHIVLDMLVQVARLVHTLHSHHFLHNDIKCCNILAVPNPQCHGAAHHGVSPPEGLTGMLTAYSQYRLYLIDYGQTTFMQGATYMIPSEERQIMGPYPYLSPEVVAGAPTSTASDVWSFGIMLKCTCFLLRDEPLNWELTPIINQCLAPFSEDRPPMQDIELWMSGLLPPPQLLTHQLMSDSPSEALQLPPTLALSIRMPDVKTAASSESDLNLGLLSSSSSTLTHCSSGSEPRVAQSLEVKPGAGGKLNEGLLVDVMENRHQLADLTVVTKPSASQSLPEIHNLCQSLSAHIRSFASDTSLGELPLSSNREKVEWILPSGEVLYMHKIPAHLIEASTERHLRNRQPMTPEYRQKIFQAYNRRDPNALVMYYHRPPPVTPVLSYYTPFGIRSRNRIFSEYPKFDAGKNESIGQLSRYHMPKRPLLVMEAILEDDEEEGEAFDCDYEFDANDIVEHVEPEYYDDYDPSYCRIM